MLRSLVLGTGALALGLGLVGGTGGAVAGAAGRAPKVPVQLSGPASCSAAVVSRFTPHNLTDAGAGPDTITVVAKLSGCNGAGTDPTGVNMTSGRLILTGALTSSTCGPILGGSGIGALSGTVTWKGIGGKVVASTVSLTGASIFYDPGLDTLTAYPVSYTHLTLPTIYSV